MVLKSVTTVLSPRIAGVAYALMAIENTRMKPPAMPGKLSGSTTLKNVRVRLAPSVRAAPARAARARRWRGRGPGRSGGQTRAAPRSGHRSDCGLWRIRRSQRCRWQVLGFQVGRRSPAVDRAIPSSGFEWFWHSVCRNLGWSGLVSRRGLRHSSADDFGHLRPSSCPGALAHQTLKPRAAKSRAALLAEVRLNKFNDFRRIWHRGRAESVNLPIRQHQELLEVPENRSGQSM